VGGKRNEVKDRNEIKLIVNDVKVRSRSKPNQSLFRSAFLLLRRLVVKSALLRKGKEKGFEERENAL
jgi:hypothetical protein